MTKKRFGWGLKNDLISGITWIDQLADEIHKPVVKKFRKRKVYVSGIDKIWAADLVDMQSFSKFNCGVKYFLTVIDVFSKFGWMLSLKDKTGGSVANALKEIFKQRKPEKIWTDKGKNFTTNTSTLLFKSWALNFTQLKMQRNHRSLNVGTAQ